jgi:hypothetical protein
MGHPDWVMVLAVFVSTLASQEWGPGVVLLDEMKRGPKNRLHRRIRLICTAICTVRVPVRSGQAKSWNELKLEYEQRSTAI